MFSKRAVVSGALLILLGLPGPGRGDDLSDLKEVFDLGIKALNARRLSLLATTFDRRLSVYAPNTPTLIGRDQYLEYLHNVFGLYDEFTVHPAETDFQVTGDTAVVTSKYVTTIRPPKRQRSSTVLARFSATYKKIDGEWLAVEIHSSIPLLPVVPVGELAERPGFFWPE